MMKIAKNTICLWYERDAEEAAWFYAKTFPDLCGLWVGTEAVFGGPEARLRRNPCTLKTRNHTTRSVATPLGPSTGPGTQT